MTLDDLLKIAGRKPRVVAVPIGDRTAYVRGLTAGDVDEVSRLADDDGPSLRVLIVAKAICDVDGNPLCGDVESHAKRLSGLPEWTLQRLYRAADEASDVEKGGTAELAGNSGEKTAG